MLNYELFVVLYLSLLKKQFYCVIIIKDSWLNLKYKLRGEFKWEKSWTEIFVWLTEVLPYYVLIWDLREVWYCRTSVTWIVSFELLSEKTFCFWCDLTVLHPFYILSVLSYLFRIYIRDKSVFILRSKKKG